MSGGAAGHSHSVVDAGPLYGKTTVSHTAGYVSMLGWDSLFNQQGFSAIRDETLEITESDKQSNNEVYSWGIHFRGGGVRGGIWRVDQVASCDFRWETLLHGDTSQPMDSECTSPSLD